ncbi:type II secretion system protein [bacterium]|nr:type II secretion system protein [bacterium]
MKKAFKLTEGLRRTGYNATNFGKIHKLTYSAGFTLAEVLITLGVIGVVAAMTIPTLMANTKGMRNRAQFKKTLSTLNQAVRMNKANYDWDFADIEADCMGSKDLVAKENPENKMSICAMMNGSLKGHSWYNYMPTTEDCGPDDNCVTLNIKTLSPTIISELLEHYDSIPLTLADGSVFDFNWAIVEGCTLQPGEKLTDMKSLDPDEGEVQMFDSCVGYIDINGPGLPNKEIECSNGVETVLDPTTPCIVKNSDITDIFPVVYHDSVIEPASNAAKYVLNTAK